MTKSFLVEIISWYGAAAILAAYALASFGLLLPSGILFQILNLTGAAALAFVSWRKKIYALVVLNFIWIIVAVVALANILANAY